MNSQFLGNMEAVFVSLASLLTIVLTARLWTLVRLFLDRTKLIHELGTERERVRDRDIAIDDLKQIAATAKLGQDSWRDEVIRLNSKIDSLQKQIEELSHRLDISTSKYEAAIEYIVTHGTEIPLAISDDVYRTRMRLGKTQGQ